MRTTGCDFSDIGYYGIWADSSRSEIEMCTFDKAGRYAIYINGPRPFSRDSSIVVSTQIGRSVLPQIDSSQYCIRVDYNNRVRISGGSLADYNQGGIYLYHSNALVEDLTIEYMDNYGINCSSGIAPRINGCTMDNTAVGIYCITNAAPTVHLSNFTNLNTGVQIVNSITPTPYLGDSLQESGENTF